VDTAATPPLSETSRIHLRGWTLVVIPKMDPFSWYVFLQGEAINEMDLEDLVVNLTVPSDGDATKGRVEATLSLQRKGLSGKRELEVVDLFPGLLEFYVNGHNITVCCPVKNSLDDAWITVGMDRGGAPSEIGGIKSLKIVISRGILDMKIEFMDGKIESVLDGPVVLQ
jgi:hypothetical protein